MKRAISGLRAWMVQRFTAIYMLLFSVFVLLHFVFNPPHTYYDWHDWITGSFVPIAVALSFAALLLHAWIGLRDVMMDYVQPLPLRITLLGLLSFVLVGLALWVMQILLLTQR